MRITLPWAKASVGLSNVDNTTDATKPVSTPQLTALNLKANALLTLNAQVGVAYTAVLGDAGLDKLMTFNNASAIVHTIPPNSAVAFPLGSVLRGTTLGVGQVTVTPGAAVTFIGGAYRSSRTGAIWMAVKLATDTWVITGDLIV